jgi:uncharacterized protein with ParB-like and HNH nuclease domain
MKAIDRPFTKIINGITQFVIPVFQRDYSWTEAECEQLWKDVIEIARDTSDRGHFLGSVVYISTGGHIRWLHTLAAHRRSAACHNFSAAARSASRPH